VDQLPLPTVILSWESAASFVERVAESNHVPMRAIRNAISTKVVDSWQTSEWQRFALLTGKTAPELLRFQRSLPRGSPAEILLGQPIRPLHLVRRRQRICPLCVSERPAIAAIWDVAHVAACPIHDIALVERCVCERELTDRNRGSRPRSCFCGQAFSSIVPTPGHPAVLTAARWIHAAIARQDPGSVPTAEPQLAAPEPFDKLNLCDLLICIEQIGRTAIALGVAPLPPALPHAGAMRMRDLSVEDVSAVVAPAVSIMSDWPGAYWDLLDGHAHRNEEVLSAAHRFSHRGKPARLFKSILNGELVRPPRDEAGLLMPVLIEAMEDWCQSRLSGPRKVKRTDAQRLLADDKLVARVAKRLGTPTGVGFSRRYTVAASPMLSSGEIPQDFEEAVAAKLRAELTIREMLNVLDDRVLNSFRHWIHPRLLEPIVDSIDRHEIRFRHGDVQRVRMALSARIAVENNCTGMSGYISLRSNGLPFYADWYTKRDLILDIIDGTVVPFGSTPDALLLDLYVHKRSVTLLEIAHRVRALAASAPFQIQSKLRKLMTAIWPSTPPLDLTALRKQNLVIAIQVDNRSEGRCRPVYRYDITDVLQMQMSNAGSTGCKKLDQAICQVRGQDNRIPVL
jgi:hypothetical protein